jgi:hypothetical protein
MWCDGMIEWGEMQGSQRSQNIFVDSCGGIVYSLGLGNSPIFTGQCWCEQTWWLSLTPPKRIGGAEERERYWTATSLFATEQSCSLRPAHRGHETVLKDG